MLNSRRVALWITMVALVVAGVLGGVASANGRASSARRDLAAAQDEARAEKARADAIQERLEIANRTLTDLEHERVRADEGRLLSDKSVIAGREKIGALETQNIQCQAAINESAHIILLMGSGGHDDGRWC